jgi:tol-pal system protein YbgF
MKAVRMSLMVVTVFFLFAFTGCSSITLIRIKELKQVEYRVDSLKTELSDTQEELLKEQKAQSELLRLIRADQQVRFDAMEQKVAFLEGGLSENKYMLSQIDKKTQEAREQWKAQVNADSANRAQQVSQIDKLYQLATGDFSAGRFDLAASGFADLAKQYPDAPVADEASYWYAECFYGKKDWDKAELAYSDYVRKYRDGKKVPQALYKLGLVFEAKKQLEKRKLVWQKLITAFPNAEESAAAKDRLGIRK